MIKKGSKAGGSQETPETDGKEDKQTETKGGGGMAGRRYWAGSPGELFCSSQALVSRIIIKTCGV